MPERIYAIGDIHGQLEKLIAVHHWISDDRARFGDTDAKVVHVGDLVDRGPDSFGVIEFLCSGLERGEPWVVLKGNHDRMFQLFLSDDDPHDRRLNPSLTWLDSRLGGDMTLGSYRISVPYRADAEALRATARDQIPQRHQEFLRGLRLSYHVNDLFFVHAGIMPGVPFDAQDEDDLLWIRAPFLDDARDHGALIVHGHTPVDEATHYGNRVNIDTGAGYGDALTAIVIEDGHVMRIGPGGRSEINHA